MWSLLTVKAGTQPAESVHVSVNACAHAKAADQNTQDSGAHAYTSPAHGNDKGPGGTA
jgi:hypothetical protein